MGGLSSGLIGGCVALSLISLGFQKSKPSRSLSSLNPLRQSSQVTVASLPSMDPDNAPEPINLPQTPSSKNERVAPELSPDSGIKWPSIPSPKLPPMNEFGWPSVWFPPKSEPRVLTPQELARLADDQAQQDALDVVTEFLKTTDVDDDDDDEYDDEYIDAIKYENGDIDDMLEEEERKRFDFFVKLFKEDSVLMDYYEKNCASGEFRCLVCFGVREKGWKRFKGCAALVHHCLSIAKTKKRKAHRAYAVSICKAIGWDINKLIHSSDKSAEDQGNIDNYSKDVLNHSGGTVDLVNDNAGEVSVHKNSNNNGNEISKGGSGSEHNSLVKDDTSKHVELLSSGFQDLKIADAKGLPNDLDPARAHPDVAHTKALSGGDNVGADLKEDEVHN